MSLPKGIQFKQVKPLGFYQEFRDYYVTPIQTYSSQFQVSDIVRMQFNLQDWYLDPYESYIEASVKLTNETPVDFSATAVYDGTNPVQLLMMDGPSTSLINDFRLEVNSKEIERIREYDQVGNLLTDLNMYPSVIDQKDYEGYYSFNNYNTSQQLAPSQQLVQPVSTQGVSASQIMIHSGGSNCPVFPQHYTTSNAGEPLLNFASLANALGVGTASTFNLASAGLDAFEYNAGTNYSGAKSSGLSTLLPNATESQVGGGIYGQIYNPSQFLGSLTAGNTNFGIQNDTSTLNVANFYAANSPKMNQIDGHNIFLTNLPTTKIMNGKFLTDIYQQPQNCAQTRAYMQIPLLSGVMGVLIPQERWQLIPTSSLGNVNIEFRFNPNAFFSHNNDIPQWQVTQFQLKLRLYRFDDQIQRQLKGQLQSGIQMHSQVFSMGPVYNIQPSVSITNNWQINNGIPSIKQLFFWFLSNDYETYPYARKNFKVCQNVTSMQLKIGSTYIPQNPILGHAGNIILNQNIPYDNSIFLSELHSSLNILFDCQKHININKVNFAVNQRPYDVTMTTALGLTSAQLTAKKKQMLLDGGYTLWNEMRCRGKAVFAFNLDSDKYNDDTMTGMDTTKARPIELILKSTDTNNYQYSSTMVVMFLSDFIVSFNANETSTDGAG